MDDMISRHIANKGQYTLVTLEIWFTLSPPVLMPMQSMVKMRLQHGFTNVVICCLLVVYCVFLSYIFALRETR